MSGKLELGFIGIGRMGAAMAGRLLDAGYAVTVFDIDETAMGRLVQRGARRAYSPAGVGSAAEIVIACLPTPDVLRAAALSDDGVVAGSKVKVFIDLSTTGPVMAKDVAAALAEKGIIALDAPISGGPTGAENGTLAIMVAGPSSLTDQVRPIFDCLGKTFWVGEEAGMGQAMKLVNNILSASAMAMTSEALVMGAKAGLDPDMMIAVINAGSGRNTATEDKFPRCVLTRRFDFGLSIGLQHKDIKLAVEFGEALGVPMIVGTAVKQLLAITKASQGFDVDLTRTVCTVEKWAGVELKRKA